MGNRKGLAAGGYAVLAAVAATLAATATGLPGSTDVGAAQASAVRTAGHPAAAAPGDPGGFTADAADADVVAHKAGRAAVPGADRPPPAAAAAPVATLPLPPAFAASLPADTTQVVRTVRTNQWCRKVYCTKTEAWEKVAGTWRLVTLTSGRPAVFRSTIGPKGFAPPGQRREDDGRAPSGVYRIVTTFSTGTTPPGAMPWRQRLATSIVSAKHNRFYNTWVENPKVNNGARASMRYGFWIDYNNPRLTPGVGPAPVIGVGSGIFYHTGHKGQEWIPTFGCTQLGNVGEMAWVVKWLDPAHNPRVVNNI